MSSRNLYNRNRPWVIERDQRLCRYCGCRTEGQYGPRALTIDHIVPRSRGGTHDEANLVVACRQCNHLKKDRLLEEVNMALLPIGTLRDRKHAKPEWPVPVGCLRCDKGQRRGGSVWCDKCVRDGRKQAQAARRTPMADRCVYRGVDWDAYRSALVDELDR